jgi:exodeoxyribonuclease V alpha subunit
VTAVTAGEAIRAEGKWIVDRQHGRQFKADEIETHHPASAAGIRKYLASGAIRSIGPQLAKKIVGLYQERTLEIFDTAPDFLLHVRGIGPKRLQRIRASWQEQKEVRRIMLFLHAHGIGSGRAVRIYRTYGHNAIATIQENPYRLADDIRGIGFRTADELAHSLGIDRNSPHRARAALRYTLRQLADEGHCGYGENGVFQKTTELVDIDESVVVAAAADAIAEKSVVRELVDGEPWLYLDVLYRSEVGLARCLQQLLVRRHHPLAGINLDTALDWVQTKLGLKLARAQHDAIRQACLHRLLIITGGPGVGKTTLVRGILEVFSAKRLKCVLAAPTGRAAKRLAETTGRTAKTIHRLLEFDPATGGFRRDEKQPLSGDLFVLDEVSMLDVVLAHQFVRAVPAGACLVLVGDVDQLPSVGPGAVLKDLIASEQLPVVRLTEIFRQARASRIVTSAYAINRGRLPDLSSSEQLSDFYFIEKDEPPAIQELVVRVVQERIPARFGFDPRTDIQVLTPMNRTPLGARQLNQILQTSLNPSRGQAEIERFGCVFRVGDRVIQTENDYSKDVFNGDLGVIHDINRIEQKMIVRFPEKPVEYDFGELDELSLAYVLTIHKSQGSEYPAVVIPLHTQHYMLLRRNLLYTAVTRGKQLVVIVGTRKALSMAVRRPDTHLRMTALARRLGEGEGLLVNG